MSEEQLLTSGSVSSSSSPEALLLSISARGGAALAGAEIEGNSPAAGCCGREILSGLRAEPSIDALLFSFAYLFYSYRS